MIRNEIECVEKDKKIFLKNVSKQIDFITLQYFKGYTNFEAKLTCSFTVMCYRGGLTSFAWASLGTWNKVAKAKLHMVNFPFRKTIYSHYKFLLVTGEFSWTVFFFLKPFAEEVLVFSFKSTNTTVRALQFRWERAHSNFNTHKECLTLLQFNLGYGKKECSHPERR